MLLITLLDDNEAKPPIIVAYLRKPHICNNIHTPLGELICRIGGSLVSRLGGCELAFPVETLQPSQQNLAVS
jgi:hypothetical protein